MALPLTSLETKQYNNVATTPPTQPLGDVINELYAGSGGNIYGELSSVEGFVTQAGISLEGVPMTSLTVEGLFSGVEVDGTEQKIIVPEGRWKCTLSISMTRDTPPGTDMVAYFGVAVNGVRVSALAPVVQESGPISVYSTIIVDLAEDDEVQGWVRAPDAGDISVDVFSAVLRVERMGA